MNVICCQFDIVWEDAAANLATIRRLLGGGRPPAGALVVLPEMCLSGFSMQTERIAESEGGPAERALSQLAKEHGIHLLAGLVVASSEGKPFNQTVWFSPEGAVSGRYRKMQPFTLGGETASYTAGERCEFFQVGGCLVAPFICYDLRFPELFRVAAWRRPQLYTVIASWPDKRIQHWVKLLQARAIENQAYVAGVNRIGQDPALNYCGRSLIVSPQGDILADAQDREGLISAELDLAALRDYRRGLPFLDDMKAAFVPMPPGVPLPAEPGNQ